MPETETTEVTEQPRVQVQPPVGAEEECLVGTPPEEKQKQQEKQAREILKAMRMKTVKSERTRAMGLIWFAYLVMAAGFLMIGPGALIAGNNAEGGIEAQMRMISIGYMVILFATPLALFLSGISVFCAWRKHSYQLRTAIFLSFAMLAGAVMSYLACEFVIAIKPIDLAIIMVAIVAAPIVLKTLIKVVYNLMGRKMWDFEPNLVVQALCGSVTLVALIAGIVFSVQRMVKPIEEISQAYQEYKEQESTLQEMVEGTGLPTTFSLPEMIQKYLSGQLDTSDVDMESIRELLKEQR